MMGALKNNAENSSSRLSSIHTEKTENYRQKCQVSKVHCHRQTN